MAYKVITSPTTEPLALSDVKSNLSIRDGLQDLSITRKIEQARVWAEAYTGRAFISQTLEIALDCFPDEIELPGMPVQSVTSINYLDTDDVEQTLSTDVYLLDTYRHTHRIVLKNGQSWPSVFDETNAIKVRYLAGFGDNASDVPPQIVAALQIAVGYMINFQKELENGAIPTRMPRAAIDFLNQYRIINI